MHSLEPSSLPTVTEKKSFKRFLKDLSKRVFFSVYRIATHYGVHIIPVHYYSSEPNIIELEKTKETWAKPAKMLGMDWNVDQQYDKLTKICQSFQQEYQGNVSYLEGVKSGYGPGYGFIEAQVLHSVIRFYKPRKILEVGSGVSTYCTFQAAEKNLRESGSPFHITCIEPFPSTALKNLASTTPSVTVVSKPVQEIPTETFANLTSNDVLFIDSSHVAKTGSDVSYLVLEILPLLNRGVIVHFHDIYFPYDHQRDVLRTFLHCNETPFLRAFLMFNKNFRTLFSLSQLHYAVPDKLKTLFPQYLPKNDWNGLDSETNPSGAHFPSSLWLETIDTPLLNQA